MKQHHPTVRTKQPPRQLQLVVQVPAGQLQQLPSRDARQVHGLVNLQVVSQKQRFRPRLRRNAARIRVPIQPQIARCVELQPAEELAGQVQVRPMAQVTAAQLQSHRHSGRPEQVNLRRPNLPKKNLLMQSQLAAQLVVVTGAVGLV